MKTVSVKSLDELVEAGVIQLTRGKIISKTDMAACPGDYPVYSSAKENDGKFGEYGRFMFDEELITWSVDGGGRLFYRPKHKFSVTNVGGVLRILDRAVLDYRYFFYALTLRHSEITFDWVKKAHPSVIRKLYADIPVPPLPEQQRIVGILDAAFDGIATVKVNAEQNLQNARALFESHLQSVFTQRGEGWVEKPFEDCIDDVKYTTKIQRKDFLDEGEFPIVSQEAEFTNGYWDKTADVFKVNKPVVIFGDHTQVLKYIDFDFVLGADGVKILPPKLFLHPKFFFYSIRSAPLKSLGYARHYRLLKELQIFYPEMASQIGIVKMLDELAEETQRLESLYQRKLAALDELKKSLLHQAFSGML